MGKKTGTFLMTVIFILCCAVMGYAFWSIQSRTDNVLTMASYKAGIVEKYQVLQHVDPSGKIEKRVEVKNEGTVDILVRVSVKKAFGVRGKDGKLKEDASLDPDMIQIAFNHRFWKKLDDGWFYYKDILRAGETTKEPLMEAYTLSPQAGNQYKGKDAEIVVCMESVQADKDAVSVWKVRREELDIIWPDAPKAEKTAVTFHGKEKGFSTTAGNTDLFSAFKNLSPGCARTQQIVVENRAREPAEIFLRAENAGQENMSEEQRILVRQLLTKYALIEVTGESGLIYKGAVCGQDGEASMRQDISLGKFAAGEKKTLTVKLSLSPGMDNRFQKLTGRVAWIFSAHGEDGTVTEKRVPVTEDGTRILMWTVLLAASGIALAIALWAERRDRRKEHESFKEND